MYLCVHCGRVDRGCVLERFLMLRICFAIQIFVPSLSLVCNSGWVGILIWDGFCDLGIVAFYCVYWEMQTEFFAVVFIDVNIFCRGSSVYNI